MERRINGALMDRCAIEIDSICTELRLRLDSRARRPLLHGRDRPSPATALSRSAI